MTQTELGRLKSACGKITIAAKPEGTGFLIAPRRVVTCEHVVRNLGSKSLEFECTDGKFTAELTAEVDPVLDCAILVLDKPSNVEPLELSSSGEPGSREWTSYGFPEFKQFFGHECEGLVRDAKAIDDRGVASLQLYTVDLAAGLGQPLHGLSGAPVVSEGLVVGHVRKGIADTRFIPTNPSAAGARPRYSAAAGVIYASPVFSVLRLLGRDVATVAESHVKRIAVKDLIEIQATLDGLGGNISRINDYGDRFIKWRYIPGLLKVRAHQVKVARDLEYEQYAHALTQLGVAYYLSGDAARAEKTWMGAEAIYDAIPAVRAADFRARIFGYTKSQPPGSLLES